MALPFINGMTGHVTSSIWEGVRLSLVAGGHPHLLLSLPRASDAVSSAVFGGGFVQLDHIVNRYVDHSYDCSDPVSDMQAFAAACGYPPASTAGLLTAVKLQQVSLWEERGSEASVLCCTTAGAGNAARAGAARTTYAAAYKPGTINTVLLIDGKLTHACLVNAVLTAAEAKAAALGDLGVRDAETDTLATGTTTDAIVVCASQSEAYGTEHRYAGTATDLGGMIGRLVYESVAESLAAYRKALP
ncbi:adenosylcobinamide amidohydrolase [Paenibacillus campinasensis]|uniref:Adenosylcobinamide amidohydrolase n=1 Tax=Paenibacillus campinasensis TaxID=66347 RepID=A0A268EWZ0_9BACL|nr:adenosylcobinamide amidohydrolase [Paenibacillus campinasensis]PAD77635.1 hypothetical protein CHH67_09230 [Paenibacillus campinasensis]